MCSVTGVYGDNCLQDVVEGARVQENRGPASSGLYIYDSIQDEIRERISGKGPSQAVFQQRFSMNLEGDMGLAHGRYVTKGEERNQDRQPMYTPKPGIIICFNGQILNYDSAKNQLKQVGWRFFSSNDLEPLMYSIAQSLDDRKAWKTKNSEQFFYESLVPALKDVMIPERDSNYMVGAYAAAGIIPGRGMIAFRDPDGIRPLKFGVKNHNNYMFASETQALDACKYEEHSKLERGELVFIDTERRIYREVITQSKFESPCEFEQVYFARGVSIENGKSNRQHRRQIGKLFAEKFNELKDRVDIVTAIPKTPIPCGHAIAENFNVPYEDIEVNESIKGLGRSFLQNSQAERSGRAWKKFAYPGRAFNGKRVLLVDDSLIRGTVAPIVIEQIFDRGAEEIHLAIMHPQYRYPCVYGIDTPDKLLAAEHNGDIESMINAIKPDSYKEKTLTLTFNTKENLLNALELENACTACIDGNYPVGSEYIKEHLDIRKSESK